MAGEPPEHPHDILESDAKSSHTGASSSAENLQGVLLGYQKAMVPKGGTVNHLEHHTWYLLSQRTLRIQLLSSGREARSGTRKRRVLHLKML